MQKHKITSLVRELKKGDKSKFNEFYELTKNAVWYAIRTKLPDENKAQDVMQDSYIAFINALDKVDENNNPLAYLLTLAKNKALDEYKKHAKEQSEEDLETYAGAVDFSSPFCDSPLLLLCKDKLGDEEYKILELTVIYGYNRVETAKILNKPVSTLNRLYHSVLKKAKQLYKEAYGENKQENQ